MKFNTPVGIESVGGKQVLARELNNVNLMLGQFFAD